MTDNLSVVQEFYGAFARGDGAAALATFSPNILWLEAEDYIYADGNPYNGPDEVQTIFARAANDWTELSAQINNMVLLGDDKVFVEGRYIGLHKTTGKSMDCQMAHVWTVEGGKITKFQQYANTAHARDVTQ